MASGPDSLAQRRAELEKRLASLSPEQRAKLAAAKGTPAAVIEEKRTVTARDPGAPVPMSFAQELLWRLERASPGHTYNVPRSVRLRGALDFDALQRALDALIVRHEALRTTFALVDDEPRQIVNAASPVVVTRIDVSGEPDGEREASARRHMLVLAQRTFDLAVDLQLQAAVIRLGDEDHVLVLMSHHVASDGWSGNIVMRELAALYNGFRTNTPVELPALPVQYADYAAWQRRTLAGERLESLLDFWRGQLAGAPTLIDIPTDHPRPLVPSFEGATRVTKLPLALLERLRVFTRSEGVTSFMVYLAVFYALVHRYTGEEEMVIGTPVAGRPHPELENVVGFFANTLLLRASLGGNPTFRELLDRVRATTLSAYEHQDIPLETLLMAKQDGNRPLATVPQVVLSTEDPEREWLKLSGTERESFGAALGGAKFELGLYVAERTDSLLLAAEYRTDLYDDATIDRMMQHFGVLLDAACAAPDTRVSDLPLMPADEREQVLHVFNETQLGVPQGTTVPALIAERARTTPDRVAAVFEGQSIADGALDAAAERFAARLASLGARPGAVVALFAERSLELIVGLLGTMKSGAAFMPIDPEYPPDRAQYMLDDANASIILTQASLRDNLPETRATIILIDDLLAEGQAEGVSSPTAITRPTANDTAYVLYTSGSTGRPKGVIVPHHCLVNHEYWFQDLARVGSGDAVLHWTSLTFDPALCEVFSPLLFGATLVIAPPGGHRDVPRAAELIAREKVTVLQTVPSILRILLDAPSIAQCTSLRLLTVGGEAMTPDLITKVHEKVPEADFYNLYGPTEATIDATWWKVPTDNVPHAIPIGAPVGNGTAYVLAPNGHPQPIGVPGELYIGGAGVANGYLGRADLTAQRFLADPFAAPGGRMYRTGDRSRWRPDGNLEFLGRLDDQVKLRGIRIELGEVEAVLGSQVGVAAAAVAVHPDGSGGERLVAYLVSDSSNAMSVADVRDGASRQLPSGVVPSAFVVLDELPLTSSGKVNRRALPAPTGSDISVAKPYVGPRTTVEHELVQIWERLLAAGRRIGVHDDFFESGGHSLLAIQMLAEVERVRGVRVPLAWLFEAATIESLAVRLAENNAGEAEPPLVVLQEKGSGPPIAFVHGDWTGGGWYMRRLAPLVAPESPFYVLPTFRAEDEGTAATVESMAERHIVELRKVQPKGPYRVAGFCVGGVVAFEIARQLTAAGEVVERVVVIDGNAANATMAAMRPIVAFLPGGDANARLTRQAEVMQRMRWLAGRARYMNRMPVGSRVTWAIEKVVNRSARLVRGAPVSPVAVAAPVSAPAAAPAPDVIEEGVVTEKLLERAAGAYIPRRYDGVVDLMWADGGSGRPRPPAPVESWSRIAGSVRVHPIGSTHIGLITENLAIFAAALREVFNQPRSHQ